MIPTARKPVGPTREQQMLCGLFLSRFDQEGLRYLGFSNFTEAFNLLGYGLGARPASIKNYRDEFDPILSQTRKGWHRRPLREHCKRALDRYGTAGLEEMGHLIKEFLCPLSALQDAAEVGETLRTFGGRDSSFTKRLLTGRAAEEYFLLHHDSIPQFSGRSITDATQWGCGFDFKLTSGDDTAFLAVEVKGMQTRSGLIQLTELEHAMAEALVDRFFLLVVRNFSERPYHTVIQDPVHSGPPFTRVERAETRTWWQTSLQA